MNFENTEVWGFEHALRGMRNALESWDKSDSFYIGDKYVIGDNDLGLAKKLVSAGSSHRKFLRQIFVSVDITAPMYFFSEFDTYKIGTVANSTSKMHFLSRNPITKDCFEMDDVNEIGRANSKSWEIVIGICEELRQEYNRTKDKRIWKELLRILPESWLQTRTVTMNYEVLLNMYEQRKSHKLNEWSGCDDPTKPNFVAWVKTLPYSQYLIMGAP